MKTKLIIVISSILLSTALSAQDSFKMQCARPLKPVSLDSNAAIRKYNTDSRNYKACFDDFMRYHKEQRAKHTKAMNEAIDEWNSYVRGDNPKKRDKSVSGITGVTSEGGHHTVDHSDPTMFYKNLKF